MLPLAIERRGFFIFALRRLEAEKIIRKRFELLRPPFYHGPLEQNKPSNAVFFLLRQEMLYFCTFYNRHFVSKCRDPLLEKTVAP